jgi:NitT/TauT family transport system substrate-binding protein
MTGKTTTRFNWKIPLYAISGLLVLMGTAALAGYAWSARALLSAGPLEQVTIAINTEYVGSCPIIVAHANGYFASEGILAVMQPHTSGKAALEAALQGRANLGTVADIPIVFAAMNRQPVSIVATIFRTEKDHGIVGRRDSGVVSPSSLRGKRVGVTMGTTGQFVLDVFLNRHRLAPSDVTRRNLKPEEFSAALARGDVDAVATWEPFLDTLLKQLGGNGTSFYSEDIYDISFNIAATREYIVRHPETIKKILRALVHGAHFCNVAPNAARALMAAGRKINTSRWEVLWPSYRFNIALDQGLVLALEDETRWAITNKLTDRTDMPNYLDYIYLDALEAVAPSAVTVIH